MWGVGRNRLVTACTCSDMALEQAIQGKEHIARIQECGLWITSCSLREAACTAMEFRELQCQDKDFMHRVKDHWDPAMTPLCDVSAAFHDETVAFSDWSGGAGCHPSPGTAP